MPTFDGRNIITGTLYEDGTIIVKSICAPTQIEPGFKLNTLQEISSRIKSKVLIPNAQIDNSSFRLSSPSELSSTQATKILNTSSIEDTFKLGSPLVEGSRQKTVIVNP